MSLAVPHVAFAPARCCCCRGGLFYQVCRLFCLGYDREVGIGASLTLAVKESAFTVGDYAVLPGKRLAPQKIVLQTFRSWAFRTLNHCSLAIAPVLGAVMLAVLAWSLSVVDVAIVLGPGNPPTLAVLAWQWLSQGDVQQQAKGTLLCLLLLLLLAALAALGYGLWKVWRRTFAHPTGARQRSHLALPERVFSGFLPACGILCAAVLLMLAQRDDVGTVSTSLSFGLLSSLVALIVIFLWLEWGPQRGAPTWVWLPLALPALPLVTGQYAIALHLGLDGHYAAVLWSHLLCTHPDAAGAAQPAVKLVPAIPPPGRSAGGGPSSAC